MPPFFLRRFCIAVAAFALLAATPRAAHAARRVFVWFADGKPTPPSVARICFGDPPPFVCPLGPTIDDCRRPIQQHLDKWYADFDVVFTYETPPAGSTFDTMVVTSEGSWCGADARTTSRSPLPDCNAMPSGSVAIFQCTDPKVCATLMTKEHAHLFGLQHTGSPADVMNDVVGAVHDGFEDKENLSAAPRCGRTQNSYRLMLARAGAWPGGPKPRPDAVVTVDAGPPFDAGTSDALADASPPDDVDLGDPPPPDTAIDSTSRVDVGMRVDGPVDAGSADVGPAPAPNEGCACQLGAPTGAGPAGFLGLLLLAFVFARRHLRVRR